VTSAGVRLIKGVRLIWGPLKVFKGTENVAIVEESEVPPQSFFHILRPF